jgi:hypothetical protein
MVCKSNFICKRYEFLKKNQNENELKINFLFNLKGQIVQCMFKGGLSIN